MKIFCVGRNYKEHAIELGNQVPEDPIIFIKPSNAQLFNGQSLIYPEYTDDLQFEGELVLKVCKNGKKIDQEFALDYISDWTVGIDFTARDIQNRYKRNGLPWEISKAFDNSAAVGRFLPFDKINYDNTTFSLLKDGEKVQEGNSSNMIFRMEYIISFISQYFTIQIGDLIFTGTPSGVGTVLPGDEFEGYLENEQVLNIGIR